MAEASAKLSPLLQSALIAIHGAIKGMTDEQLSWHPGSKWSSVEILEHLSLAYSRTAERMRPFVQQELPAVRRRTFKEWAGGVIVLKIGRIPSGRKAPEGLSPKGMSPSQARTCIEERLLQLDQAIDLCEQRFGASRNILDHAILGPLSTSEWRKFHYVHTLHHMNQIHVLREKINVGTNSQIKNHKS
ncbi:MAG TPA: DUF1569 domain-containing protein [Candidatus Angelobacter sp.]|nr:DUF1569 domain-containing protein [Candidatus Angelobacter sp.]